MNKDKSYKEILKDIEKWESVRSENQGRSKKQIEGNYKIFKWAFVSFIILIIVEVISKVLNIW